MLNLSEGCASFKTTPKLSPTSQDFQKQISKCKNSDNFFVSISKNYKNASHILNATIANYCDLNRNIVKSKPENNEDTFYSAVCVFRNHFLREE